MRTAWPVTPRPPPSPRPSCRRAPGSGTPVSAFALHGAAPLATERLLLLPVPVPGGARAAREGAAGQMQPSFAFKLHTNGVKPWVFSHASLRSTLWIHSCCCGELASCCTVDPITPTLSVGGLESGFQFSAMITIISDSNLYSSFGATLERDDEKNLWSMPHDVSHTEADDDRILYNLIVIRNQQTKDSEEWQRLNYDIYSLRQIRREVRNRWRRILEDLGFQREADSLLSVTKLSTMSDSKNTRKAREMLLKLAEETTIFPASWELSERYLLVVILLSEYGLPRIENFKFKLVILWAQKQNGNFPRIAGSKYVMSN
ncbi:melanoregulin-like protein [Cricetulus griseus]|nr:melanoregulin-like protein [Cricetulus griseus]